jgi:hypothetical protein
METESNDESGQKPEQDKAPPRKPYKPPVLADYGAAGEETKVGRRHAAPVDLGSS